MCRGAKVWDVNNGIAFGLHYNFGHNLATAGDSNDGSQDGLGYGSPNRSVTDCYWARWDELKDDGQ